MTVHPLQLEKTCSRLEVKMNECDWTMSVLSVSTVRWRSCCSQPCGAGGTYKQLWLSLQLELRTLMRMIG